MSNYDTLKKIIPPDQALANQALSRSLRQVKDIFNTDLPTLSAAVSQLESNKDLDLINSLTEPVPPVVANFIGNTLATGSGPGNTITINDVVGVAAGATVNDELPVVTTVVSDLANIGALDPLTGNGGTPSSVNNGIYTLMSYALIGTYSNVGNVEDTTTIPITNYYPHLETPLQIPRCCIGATIGSQILLPHMPMWWWWPTMLPTPVPNN